MSKMTTVFLGDLQSAVAVWQKKNFPTASVERKALKVAEEAGEVAGIVVRLREGRPGLTCSDFADEAGDLLIALAGLCDMMDVSLERAVQRRWEAVRRRDYTELTSA